MAVRPRELWVVHGSNGAGKTTLLRTLYGDHGVAVGGKIERAGIVPGVPLEVVQEARRAGRAASAGGSSAAAHRSGSRAVGPACEHRAQRGSAAAGPRRGAPRARVLRSRRLCAPDAQRAVLRADAARPVRPRLGLASLAAAARRAARGNRYAHRSRAARAHRAARQARRGGRDDDAPSRRVAAPSPRTSWRSRTDAPAIAGRSVRTDLHPMRRAKVYIPLLLLVLAIAAFAAKYELVSLLYAPAARPLWFHEPTELVAGVERGAAATRHAGLCRPRYRVPECRGRIRRRSRLARADRLAPRPHRVREILGWFGFRHGRRHRRVQRHARRPCASASRNPTARSGLPRLCRRIRTQARQVLERATGQRYAQYLSERLWKRIGAADARLSSRSPGLLARQGDWIRRRRAARERRRLQTEQIVPRGWIAQHARGARPFSWRARRLARRRRAVCDT